MAKSLIANAWRTYRKRKTRIGIITDFLFLIIVIVAVVPQLRLGFCVYAIRATLTQPRPYDKVLYLQNDSSVVQTAAGADTTVHWINSRPTIYNFCSLLSAQSRAEMKSLNHIAEYYQGSLNVYLITDDDPEEFLKYINKRGYKYVRPLFYTDDNEAIAEHDFISEIRNSVPSTLLISSKGRVLVKKFGAAKWYGNRVKNMIDETIGEK